MGSAVAVLSTGKEPRSGLGITTAGLIVGAGLFATGGAGTGFTVFLPPQATKKMQQNRTSKLFFFIEFSLFKLY